MTASLPVLYPADESRTRLHSASSLVEELSTHQEHVHEEFKSIAHQKLAERLASATDETVKADLICWMTDCCLVRYLRANQFSLEGAVRMLEETLKWRGEFQPSKITFPTVEPEAVTGKCYINGFDRHCRPILYIRPGRENTSSHTRQMQFFVLTVEKALQLMPPGVDKFVVIMDFDGYSFSNAPPLATTIEILKIFSGHYPERLAKLFLLNTSWVFSSIYKLLTPFIRATTQSKIFFLTVSRKTNPRTHKTKAHEQMWHYIPPEQLERSVGGYWEWEYTHEVYWPAILSRFNEDLGRHQRNE